MIGLDVVLSVAEALHAEFREPHLAPPLLLLRMVEGNLLGRKTAAASTPTADGAARAAPDRPPGDPGGRSVCHSEI
ncbi:3-hydroxyacyl-CoA dehydrogenase family protein [Streptomyces johnsoniae]|uniref:3-hydroxyacyl-CoA dehydrogenase family protein n=1 Tax=Streptomyces johnsoniae TaxID=3075532 RepID=A0ABU2RYP8_9ACTN|nr:3-hydroxyacyl-CoA dehydrogenase family protein [Streptomyces sp. DSM 41886]MDT0441887.1 3-hydroxyacyl-CoA dehydrogenase family protein [Streptomyces sp. DSM 41886]